MQILRARLGKQHGLRGGVIAVNRGAVHIALCEADDLARFEIDGGENDHGKPLHHPLRGRSPSPFLRNREEPSNTRFLPVLRSKMGRWRSRSE